MKKIWLLVLAGLICSSIAACSADESDSSSASTSPSSLTGTSSYSEKVSSVETSSSSPEITIDGSKLYLSEFNLTLTFPDGWTLTEENKDNENPPKQSAVNQDKSQQVFIQELPRNDISSMDSFIEAYSKEVQNESLISNFSDKGTETLGKKEFRCLELQSEVDGNTLYQVSYFHMNENTILQIVETSQKKEDLNTVKDVLAKAE